MEHVTSAQAKGGLAWSGRAPAARAMVRARSRAKSRGKPYTQPCAKPLGFTIVELLVSVAIIGILASVAMPVIQTALTRQKEAQLRLALTSIRGAIDAYKQATVNGNIPVLNGQSGYPPSLTSLVGGVPDAKSTTGAVIYFLRSVPRDPFYPDLTTPSIQTWTLRSYASPPDNPAPGDNVFDVQSMSTQAGLNGIPYDQW